MDKIVFGIDVGKSGAIAVANQSDIKIVKMPKDTKTLKRFFEGYDPKNSVVFMEKVSAFIGENDLKKYAIIKMLGQARELKTVLEFMDFRVIEVAPVTWQTRLGLKVKGMEKAERKKHYYRFAMRYAFKNKIYLYQGDAVCILACGVKLLKENDPLVSKKFMDLDLF